MSRDNRSPAPADPERACDRETPPLWLLPVRPIYQIAGTVEAEVQRFSIAAAEWTAARAKRKEAEREKVEGSEKPGNSPAPPLPPPPQVGIIGDFAAGKSRAVIRASRTIAAGGEAAARAEAQR
jgi:hypothetical protein